MRPAAGDSEYPCGGGNGEWGCPKIGFLDYRANRLERRRDSYGFTGFLIVSPFAFPQKAFCRNGGQQISWVGAEDLMFQKVKSRHPSVV